MTSKIVVLAFGALIAGAMPAFADETFFAEQKPTEYLAKDRLIGLNVHDNEGKVIGEIEDLVVDGDNKIVGVIIGVGGLLGVGEKKVAVSLPSLGIEAAGNKVNVTMPAATKEALTAAPAYKRANPPIGWLQRAVKKGEEIHDKTKDAYHTVKEGAESAVKGTFTPGHEQPGQSAETSKAN